MVGMGSVVIRNIPDGETRSGIPAMPLKRVAQLLVKLKKL
jgi:hypothetical protein